MRKICLVVLACACLTGPVAASETVVIEADDDYAPYSYIEQGQLKGIYVDFLKKIAPRLAPDYTVVLRPVPWKRGLANLERGDSLALIPPYFNKGRNYIQSYSSALNRESVVLYCSEVVMARPHKQFPGDFAGLVVGINRGFLLGEKITAAKEAGMIRLEEAKGNEANLKKLNAGHVDCYANDRLSVLFSARGLRNKPEFKDFVLHETIAVSDEDAYVGYSAAHKAHYKAAFIEKMNAAITEAKKAGEMNRLIAEYAP